MKEMYIDLFDAFIEAKAEVRAYRHYSISTNYRYDCNKDISYQNTEGYVKAMRDAIYIFGKWNEYREYRKSDEGRQVYKDAYNYKIERLQQLNRMDELFL